MPKEISKIVIQAAVSVEYALHANLRSQCSSNGRFFAASKVMKGAITNAISRSDSLKRSYQELVPGSRSNRLHK
ncbi:hypothetical protein G6F42_026676 [Rhizopus arrhizus]|nr:hypothetical protein G6F42_026676 [Rhizopus arrhizus]